MFWDPTRMLPRVPLWLSTGLLETVILRSIFNGKHYQNLTRASILGLDHELIIFHKITQKDRQTDRRTDGQT